MFYRRVGSLIGPSRIYRRNNVALTSPQRPFGSAEYTLVQLCIIMGIDDSDLLKCEMFHEYMQNNYNGYCEKNSSSPLL